MPTVITKKSTVAAKVPLSTDLQVGELAVNTADKILYTKHSDNSIVKLGGVPAGTIAQVQFNDGTSFAGDSGLTYDATAKALTIGGATVTSSNPPVNVFQTWNNSGATFTGNRINITDSASAADSLIEDWRVNNVSKASISKVGTATVSSLVVNGGTVTGITAAHVGAIPTGGLKTVNGNSLEGSGNLSVTADLTAPGPIGGTTPSTITATGLTVTGGTVTASTPVINVTQTWNNAAVAFTGRVTNITNTSSAAASLIEDWQVGGMSKASIRKDGAFGSQSAWLRGFTYAGHPAWGYHRDTDSVPRCVVSISGVNVAGSSSFVTGYSWSAGDSNALGVVDTALLKLGTGLVGVTDGNPGTFRDLKLRNLITAGSISTGLLAKTADYTLTANDGTITVDSTSAAVTLTLETAVGHNRIHCFKKTAGSNTVTIDGNASETIDGSASVTLTDRVILQSNGTNWIQIA